MNISEVSSLLTDGDETEGFDDSGGDEVGAVFEPDLVDGVVGGPIVQIGPRLAEAEDNRNFEVLLRC